MNQISVSEGRFVDESGRHVILHGINLNCKDKENGYIGNWTRNDFENMKKWGFNVIRLGIIWDGVEPSPGYYNEAYLEKLLDLIRLAAQQDLYVFLDMHQDLYSCLFSDGAPVWATLTDGEQYEPSDLWSEAYWNSGAVQRAFDHFWRNTPASDGIGLQDHYIAAWVHVAKRLGNEPNVIGYDLMNEPSMGSDIQKMIEGLLSSYVNLSPYYTGTPSPSVEELAQIWDDPRKKRDVFHLIENSVFFSELMDSVAPIQADFEQGVLTELYNKITRAIRSVDSSGIVFLETNYMANAGVSSSIQPVTRLDGKEEENQAYAPHGYDLVTDSQEVHNPNNDRVEFIFQRHEETRDRMKIPMLIGEWGAYMDSEAAGEASLYIKGIFERLLCSDTYWLYHDAKMDHYSSFIGICRGYPMAVSGQLVSYSYDPATFRYSMQWVDTKNNTELTKVYLPRIDTALQLVEQQDGLTCEPIHDSQAGYLYIESNGEGMRTLQIG